MATILRYTSHRSFLRDCDDAENRKNTGGNSLMAMVMVCDALDAFERASASLQLAEWLPDLAEDAVAGFEEVLSLSSKKIMPGLHRKALIGLAEAYERRCLGKKQENRSLARIYRQQAES
jgi:hypothetical protein